MTCNSCKHYTPLNDVERIMLALVAEAIHPSEKDRDIALNKILKKTCKYELCNLSMDRDRCPYYKRKWWMIWG